MLVLSRKPGERILIGPHIAVTIVRLGPNTVRVGIEAPDELAIVREELLDAAETAPGEKWGDSASHVSGGSAPM